MDFLEILYSGASEEDIRASFEKQLGAAKAQYLKEQEQEKKKLEEKKAKESYIDNLADQIVKLLITFVCAINDLPEKGVQTPALQEFLKEALFSAVSTSTSKDSTSRLKVNTSPLQHELETLKTWIHAQE